MTVAKVPMEGLEGVIEEGCQLQNEDSDQTWGSSSSWVVFRLTEYPCLTGGWPLVVASRGNPEPD
jgi:hypothetical protein